MAVTSVLFVPFIVDNFVYQTDDITDSNWQSPSWEADTSSASLEIPLLLWTHHALLLCSQHSSSAVLPEPVKSNPLSPILFL
jgi:hypothetical protein